MDIVTCTYSNGEKCNYMDLIDPSMKTSCEKYVDKCHGPETVYRAEKGKTAINYLDEAFEPLKQYKDKIAYVIDASTTRGFCEPSQASLYA